MQKSAGLPIELPYDVHQLTPILKKKNGVQSDSKLSMYDCLFSFLSKMLYTRFKNVDADFYKVVY